jgi:hypothetical protein
MLPWVILYIPKVNNVGPTNKRTEMINTYVGERAGMLMTVCDGKAKVNELLAVDGVNHPLA